MTLHMPLSFLYPGIVITLGLGAPLLLAASAQVPGPGTEFIVLTPPWENAARRVVESGGVVVAQGRLPFIALTYAPGSGMLAELTENGPVLFVDSRWGTALCT